MKDKTILKDSPLNRFVIDLAKGRPLRPTEILALLPINGFEKKSSARISQILRNAGISKKARAAK